jgi:hypothetical protein
MAFFPTRKATVSGDSVKLHFLTPLSFRNASKEGLLVKQRQISWLIG